MRLLLRRSGRSPCTQHGQLRSTAGWRRLLATALGSPPHLRIVSVNDVYELHNLPQLRTLIDEQRRSAGQAAFLTTVNGDFVSPSILSGLDQGHSMVDALNKLPITHCCFGNHE